MVDLDVKISSGEETVEKLVNRLDLILVDVVERNEWNRS